MSTVLCALASLFAYKLLWRKMPKPEDDPAPFYPFILLMAKMVFWFVLGVVLLSVVSTIVTWLYFLWLRKKKGIVLQLQFERDAKHNHRMYAIASIDKVRRPLLGFVKGRLVYDNHELTDRFSLLSDKRKENSIWRAAISGRNRLLLPDVKEYELRKGIVFFEDMLHLFSLAVVQPLQGHFYQPPQATAISNAQVFPKKTETMDVRIEQMKPVEGEPLNYKDFETGDDVRRIVWKIYARNRELMVRVPERFEPYASHLYFYASFQTGKDLFTANDFAKEMLNYYKNAVWAVHQLLSKKEWELRYIPEQPSNIAEDLSKEERTARIISNAEWQNSVSLNHYFNARNGAVLCISSLIPLKELAQVLHNTDASTVIYYVKCSQVFHHNIAWNWLKKLFFLPPKDRLKQLKTKWVFAPFRFQLRKQEKEIERLLKASSAVYEIL
jgi:hypothetical protein